jgi:predicted DNA-binding protein
MKRLQFFIDEELLASLEREARRTGRSKAAVVREALRRHLPSALSIRNDALWRMVGAASFDPVPPEAIDDIVYADA